MKNIFKKIGIYFGGCNIKQPHDFSDDPCERCNAPIMITKDAIYFSGKTMLVLRNIIYSIVVNLILVYFLYVK